MKNWLSIFTFFAFFTIFAQTTVSGNQSGIWSLANSPYQVTGNINIPQGQTLTIEAGVEVNFQGHYKITVLGKIITNGTETSPILFTANNYTNGWGGILIDHSSQISIFNYTTFEFGIATGNFPDMHGGAIKLNEANAEFYHCIFRNNKAVGSGDDGMGGAVYGINTGSSNQTLTKFIDCKFIDNQSITEGGAIKFTNDGKTEINRCQFINNQAKYGGGAIMFYSALDVHLTQCLFYNNTTLYTGGGAIKAMNPDVSLVITNCSFVHNSAPTSEGGAMALDYTTAQIINSIIFENTQQYEGEIKIGLNTTVTINYSDLNMPDDATGNNNLDNLDPQFIDINNGNLHLQSTSPCIDAGVNIGLPYVGNAPDMGCFEFENTNKVDYNLFANIKIFPNPAKDKIIIKGLVNNYLLEIYDISGKKINIIQKDDKDGIYVDVSTLGSGIYILKINNKISNFSYRFIKK